MKADYVKPEASTLRPKSAKAFPVALLDEANCVDLFKRLRWGVTPTCPYCGDSKISGLQRPGQQKCARCRRTFSFKVGSIVQGSSIPLWRWFQAIWLVTQRDKGVTSSELARELASAQNSAWRMLRHLRLAATTDSFWRARGEESETGKAIIVWQIEYRTRRVRNEKRFKLDLSFDEALQRFIAVDRRELLSVARKEGFSDSRNPN